MNMDSLDTGLTLDSLVFAIDAIQPYVLGWPLGEELHGRGGRGHSLANHAGLLLALPSVFLPQAVIDHGNSGEDGIFGPSVLVNAPAVIFEGGIVSPTGTTVDAMIIDCTVDVLVYMREFQQYEDLVYNFDEDSPYAFPAIDALLPKIHAWAASSLESRAGYYTPEELEEEESPPSRSQAAKKKSCRKGYAYRRWTKAQATNYGITGIRHAGPLVDPSQDHRAVVTDLREASGVGEPHPPAWEGTCHRIGSVTCKQLERSTTTSLGADAHSQTPSNPISNTQTALSWKHQTFSEKVSKIKHMSRCEA